MQRPEPDEQHRRLELLAGEWEGQESLQESQSSRGGSATGTFNFRVALDGFFLLMDYAQRTDDEISLRGHGVIGWDSAQKCYTLHWFDNFGSPPRNPGRGQWQGDTLLFEHEGPKHLGRTTLRLVAQDLAFKVEMKVEGKDWSTALEGNYRPK